MRTERALIVLAARRARVTSARLVVVASREVCLLRSIALASVALFTLACTGNTERCVTGITISCPCLGGSDGVQTCQADGTFGACQCGSPDAGTTDAAVETDAASDAASEIDAASETDAASDPCTGHVTYAGVSAPVGPLWSSAPSAGGLTGLEAGNAVCVALGADHVCDLTEINVAQAAGELASVPAGTTLWMHRTTTVTIGGVDSPPGPGGRCNDWTYATNHTADGEYITFDTAGEPTYHFDADTVFDPSRPEHATPGDLDCGGRMRSIACCYPTCTP